MDPDTKYQIARILKQTNSEMPINNLLSRITQKPFTEAIQNPSIESLRSQYEALVSRCQGKQGYCSPDNPNCGLEKCIVLASVFFEINNNGLTGSTADALLYGDPSKLSKKE